ncbi:hypothetical protein OPV22_011595 [Ensete ventricosum]|uniref:Uncharacterized protein n=1 Tax=Ensete ventricosum TaxID=4639 RepID=A0AAV8RNU2_ENSVE|nr:hypothetical protein OPV22_011595 [Ensete ventricosum]
MPLESLWAKRNQRKDRERYGGWVRGSVNCEGEKLGRMRGFGALGFPFLRVRYFSVSLQQSPELVNLSKIKKEHLTGPDTSWLTHIR